MPQWLADIAPLASKAVGAIILAYIGYQFLDAFMTPGEG